MQESGDLRKILSQNTKKARKALHITQAKLSERAGISVFHIIEIEQCKSWVSDKTLANIAQALHLEAYELLLPDLVQKTSTQKEKRLMKQQIAELIREKRDFIRQNTVDAMEDLTLEILQLFNKADK